MEQFLRTNLLKRADLVQLRHLQFSVTYTRLKNNKVTLRTRYYILLKTS